MFPSVAKVYFPARFIIRWTVLGRDRRERATLGSLGADDQGLGSCRYSVLLCSISITVKDLSGIHGCLVLRKLIPFQLT